MLGDHHDHICPVCGEPMETRKGRWQANIDVGFCPRCEKKQEKKFPVYIHTANGERKEL